MLRCVLVLFLVGCTPRPEAHVFNGPIMGTSYRVTVVARSQDVDRTALGSGVVQAMAQVNAQMSTYLADSELSRFNAYQGVDWFPVSRELALVVQHALATSRVSDGAFDVTVGPLVNLWGFGPEPDQRRVPAADAVASARRRVGHRLLEVRDGQWALRKKRPDLYVDLSAIAKGYAVDQVCAYLDDQGLDHYLVDIGGELRARGLNDRGQPWQIGIETPSAGERSVYRIVQVADRAVATSGDYRNYFEQDGRRFSHTVDPTTGRPITHTLASASVVAASAMQADALATALLVLGPERGMELAERLDIAALLIVKDNDGFLERYTPKFEQFVVNP